MRTRLFVFVSIVQAILFLAHWFVYATLAYFYGGWTASREAKLAFGLLSVSFVAASLRGWYSFHPLVRTFYAAAAAWLGLFSFFFVASIASWIIYATSAIAGWGWERWLIADAMFAMAIAATLYGIVNAALLRVTRVTIALDNLPPQWRGRKAVLVSDLHLGHIRNYGFVTRVVRRVAGLQPDIVLIAGDLYDGVAGDFERLALPWKELVSGKAASHGIYYIPGNHEEFYAHAEYLPALLRSGVRVLNNEKVEVDGLQIAGVHYRDATNPERYLSILRSLGLDRGRASILLLHAPVRLPISEAEGISLQLSGHTHGGQFFPWTWVVRRVWGKFAHGLQLSGKMRVYTTYGTGTWGPPLRVGTKPEIVLITFA
ncbi:MAG: metallophosphoesterase [Candidatus Angelobacter sp.]